MARARRAAPLRPGDRRAARGGRHRRVRGPGEGHPVTGQPGRLREAVRRPLPLAYHPLYRFYQGGSLTRTFRGLPERPDDWWSEDWVGSCIRAGNDDPDGRPQGMSPVDLPGIGPVALGEVVAALPEEMVGARFAGRYGPITGVLVKLLSPAGQVPLHAH